MRRRVPFATASRRRTASLLVLLIAGLAVAGTSAKMPPPPLATAAANGTLEVTADRPIAAIEVTLEANAILHGVPGSSIVARVVAQPKIATTDGPAVVLIEPLDDPTGINSMGPTASVTGQMGDGCAPGGACVRRYRITAILVEPEVNAAVTWNATAEFRFDGPNRPSAAPAEGRLAVTSGEVTVRPASEVGRASLKPETVHLDRDHPFASREVDIDQPTGPPGVGQGRTWLAFLEVTAPDAAGGGRPGIVQVVESGRQGALTRGTNGRLPFYPPACSASAGCTTPLRVDASLPGGLGDLAADITWSIVMVAYGPIGDPPPAPLAVRLLESTAIDATKPHLVASETGTFDIARDVPVRRNATITLDANQIPPGDGLLTGHLQVRYEVATTSTGPAQPVNLALGSGDSSNTFASTYGSIKSGQAGGLVSEVLVMDCGHQGPCVVHVPIFAGLQVDAQDGVDVAWTLTALWFPDPPDQLPPNGSLTLTTASASAPP